MKNLLEIINKDIEKIFSSDFKESEKVYFCTRCITSCMNILDNILTKKEIKQTISKKMLVIYSYIINMDDIEIYDVLMYDIYNNIKTLNHDFAEKFHYKCLFKKKNIEYHLNMIMFYKKNNETTSNLYNYYFNVENYYNCLKLLDYSDTDYFYKKMILCNNICDFENLDQNISKIIEYSKNNMCSPYLLICMGLGNTIMNNCVKRYYNTIYNDQSIRLTGNVDVQNITSPKTPKICLIVDNSKYNLENYIINQFDYVILDLVLGNVYPKGKTKAKNVEIIQGDLNKNNQETIYELLIKHKFYLAINFCSLNNVNVFRLLSMRIAKIQINNNDYLGSHTHGIFDYIILGKCYNEMNKNYAFNEKKIILDCPIILNIDYNKSYDFEIKKNYDYIIYLINKNINKMQITDFMVDYIYKVIKFNIRNINRGIYNKELLIERQIKTIMDKMNNDSNYTGFQNNYSKIRDLKKGTIKEKQLYSMYYNIILPRNKHKDYFRFCVLSGSKKISKKDILIYNQILKMAHGSVLYILETVCFENRDMLLKHFDEDIKEKVYFIPFIEPQLNLYRLIYFDCILDTLNYNLKNTIYDLLVCKVPIMCFQGNHLYSTITSSILKTLNLTDTICLTIDDFIKKSVKMSYDTEYYNYIKETFNNNNVKSFYPERYTEKIINSIIKLII